MSFIHRAAYNIPVGLFVIMAVTLIPLAAISIVLSIHAVAGLLDWSLWEVAAVWWLTITAIWLGRR